MEGEPPKVFTVDGQGGEIAVNHNPPLHLPQPQAAQTSICEASGEAKNSTRATPETLPLLMGALYGPRPPIADPTHAKFARGGNTI